MQKWLTKMVVQPLTIFGKSSTLGVSQGYEYICHETKQKPGTFSFISQKIRNTVPADFFHF